MNLVAIGQLAVALGLGGIIVAIINTVISPKTRQEARAIASKTAGEVVQQSLDTLRADVADARLRAEKAERRADLLAERVDALEGEQVSSEKQIRALQADLDSALEQTDLLGRQLIEAQEQTKIARKAEKAARDQVDILRTHITVLDNWARRYFEAGHPPGMEPPPILVGFEQ